MPPSLRFIPGNTVRWRARRFVVVDYASMDAIIARELGKRAFRRIPIKEAVADLSPGDRRAWTPDLVSVSKDAWQTAVKRFKTLKPLLELNGVAIDHICSETVIASWNAIVVSRQIAEHFRVTQLGVDR